MPAGDPLAVIDDEIFRQRVRDRVAAERRSHLTRILEAPLTTIIIAAVVGGSLTFYYDRLRLQTEHQLLAERSAAERKLAQHEIELTKTFETFENLSHLIDRRLWHTRQLIWISGRNPTLEQLAPYRTEYAKVVDEWNENYNRNLALVERYFGADARVELETTISSQFRQLHHDLGKPGHDLFALDAAANRLNERTYAFNRLLLSRTRSFDRAR
ncbi:MAG: hypothetical protein AABO58_07910 [Acidobacteriota bacterium]